MQTTTLACMHGSAWRSHHPISFTAAGIMEIPWKKYTDPQAGHAFLSDIYSEASYTCFRGAHMRSPVYLAGSVSARLPT